MLIEDDHTVLDKIKPVSKIRNAHYRSMMSVGAGAGEKSKAKGLDDFLGDEVEE